MKTRFLGLDILRGVLLVLMAVSHLPTRFRAYSNDFFGMVSAAEGFIFLAAFLTAFLYAPRAETFGWPHVREKLLARTKKLYRYHIGLLFVAFASVFLLAERTALARWFGFFLSEPVQAMLGAATLVYRPPLFDILPLYILFMALSPFVLERAVRTGFRYPFIVSLVLWGAAQLGARQWLHLASEPFHALPAEVFGAFDVLGWQLLWMIGLYAGTKISTHKDPKKLAPPRWLWGAALLVCGLCLYLRYGNLDSNLEESFGYAVDKWRLAPLRILNLAGFAVLLLRFGKPLARLPVLASFGHLGRSSLQVFSTHLVLCLVCCAVYDDMVDELSVIEELLVLLTTGVAMALVPLFWNERSAAPASTLEKAVS